MPPTLVDMLRSRHVHFRTSSFSRFACAFGNPSNRASGNPFLGPSPQHSGSCDWRHRQRKFQRILGARSLQGGRCRGELCRAPFQFGKPPQPFFSRVLGPGVPADRNRRVGRAPPLSGVLPCCCVLGCTCNRYPGLALPSSSLHCFVPRA